MSTDGVAVTELLVRLGIARRALYYDLPKINDWLAYYKLGTVEVTGGKLVLYSENSREVARLLSSFSAYHFSVEERRAMEILCIALDATPVTSERLQSLLDVSKNTVLNDIKEWKVLLEPFRLRIDNTGKKGYRLLGEEVAVRKLIGQQLYVLENEYPKSTLVSLLQNSLATLTGNHRVDFRNLVKTGVQDYEHSINTWLVLSEMDYEIAMILAACIRYIKGFPYKMDAQEKEALKNTREYSAVLLIIRKLYDADIDLRLDESYYITILFLGIKNFDFNSSAAENSYIQQFSINLVYNFERIACVSFEDKRQFLNRLCQHIRPMYYRLKYGIRVGNTLLDQIQAMYTSVYEYTRRAVQRTGGEMNSLITQEELAYLCIYMASFLGEATPKPQRQRQQVLIICGAGVAASVLLREQLAELLGDAFEYHLVPAPRVAGENLSAYCLIVTTVPMDAGGNKVLQTGPILSEESKNRIVNIVSGSSEFFSAGQEAAEILEVVRKSVKLQDESRLLRDLLRYTIQKERAIVPPGPAPSLREVLQDTSSIRISEADTLEAAIWDAGGLLGGSLHRDVFASEMLSHIHPRKDICEISDGVALEYCLKSNIGGVGMGIVLLPRCHVKFGNKEVRMLVVLATVDNATHYPLLNEIYRYFGDPRFGRLMLDVSSEQEASKRLLDWMDKVDILMPDPPKPYATLSIYPPNKRS